MSHPIGSGRKYDYEAVFRYIVTFKKEHDGNAPTLRQIGSKFDIDTPSVTNYILIALEKQGRIRLKGDHHARRIEVVGGQWSMSV